VLPLFEVLGMGRKRPREIDRLERTRFFFLFPPHFSTGGCRFDMSVQLKHDAQADKTFGWALEMWGWSIAAAKLKVCERKTQYFCLLHPARIYLHPKTPPNVPLKGKPATSCEQRGSGS
jgi:hypothetical protein